MKCKGHEKKMDMSIISGCYLMVVTFFRSFGLIEPNNVDGSNGRARIYLLMFIRGVMEEMHNCRMSEGMEGDIYMILDTTRTPSTIHSVTIALGLFQTSNAVDDRRRSGNHRKESIVFRHQIGTTTCTYARSKYETDYCRAKSDYASYFRSVYRSAMMDTPLKETND